MIISYALSQEWTIIVQRWTLSNASDKKLAEYFPDKPIKTHLPYGHAVEWTRM